MSQSETEIVLRVTIDNDSIKNSWNESCTFSNYRTLKKPQENDGSPHRSM